MSAGFFVSDRVGAVVRLTIDRAENMNPIGLPGDGDALASEISAANANAAIRCLVITAAGRAFSAGGDLKAMRARSGPFAGSPAELRVQYRANIHRMVEAVFEAAMPVVAAINGPAVGLGCDLACACDLRIAASNATFSVPFLRIGLVPGDGGTWLLPRAIGMARASQLLFTGATIDAQTALEWGLVSEVVDPDVLGDRAMELAEQIAAQPGAATRLTKALLRRGEEAGRAALMEMSAMAQAIVHHTPDHEEGVTALLERRTPSFNRSETDR